jgi:uncharacterized membrane-anchored protein YitT (DUF2179 family)
LGKRLFVSANWGFLYLLINHPIVYIHIKLISVHRLTLKFCETSSCLTHRAHYFVDYIPIIVVETVVVATDAVVVVPKKETALE